MHFHFFHSEFGKFGRMLKWKVMYVTMEECQAGLVLSRAFRFSHFLTEYQKKSHHHMTMTVITHG